MKEIQLVGGSYEDDSVDADATRAINLFLELDNEGGRHAMVGTPGMTEFSDLNP